MAFDPTYRSVQELQKSYRNVTDEPVLLSDPYFLTLSLPAGYLQIDYFESSWGREFTPRVQNIISSEWTIRNDRGRCSAQSAPFFTLSSETMKIDFAICTSGNYEITVKDCEDSVLLTIRDADEDFSTEVPPGGSFTFPMVLAHVYAGTEECYREKQQYRSGKLLSSSFYDTLPVLYNHWWAYEDKYINEDILLRNAQAAREIGAEMVVLDAGWFGSGDQEEDWYTVRGDWDLVNGERFPHGLASIREQLAKMGLRLGIWCEIEGLGSNSVLLRQHPEFAAVRDGQNLGYVCLGSRKAQDWAYGTMARLFRQCGGDYWKLDFNLDPGLGCNCPDHDHGEHDGLQKHYEGLYRVLDRLKSDYPGLVIENCSSGGQRLNLEMAEHAHLHFLSDPDYSAHQMHLFKEASKWLLPRQLLHFMWSNTVCTGGSAPFPNLNLKTLPEREIKYHLRLAMMHPFGISHRLIDYSQRTLDILKKHLAVYKERIRPFIAHGEYLPLYLSETLNVFSFTLEGDVLLFLFAETAGTASFELKSVLSENVDYIVQDFDSRSCSVLPAGKSAWTFLSDTPWSSQLLMIKKN